jgi:hypothetical protein
MFCGDIMSNDKPRNCEKCYTSCGNAGHPVTVSKCKSFTDKKEMGRKPKPIKRSRYSKGDNYV